MLVTSSADLMLWERSGVLVGTVLGVVNTSGTEIARYGGVTSAIRRQWWELIVVVVQAGVPDHFLLAIGETLRGLANLPDGSQSGKYGGVAEGN